MPLYVFGIFFQKLLLQAEQSRLAGFVTIIKLIKKVKNKTSLPIIICGGVGNSHDFLKAFPYKLSGLAAANFFHYTEHSVISLKGYLRQNEKKEFIF